MQRIALFAILLLLVGGSFTGAQDSSSNAEPTSGPITAEKIEKQLEEDFDVSDIAASSAWAESLGIADWLGPLAPVALSPFFGVMCLSGLAIWGPQWVSDNALLGESGPLQSETIFLIFVGLTLLTSLPRLTKVSKPFAQAVDRLETYAVIVILLVLKLISSVESSGETEVAIVQLGVFSFTFESLLSIAMIVNIMIVNSVKFFFEFLIWLTPIPFIDAIFEVCNKTVCATLMAIYAFSPTVATVINFVILLVAAILFRWISRRVRFFRTMVLDPVLSQLWSGYRQPTNQELTVFSKQDLGPFQEKSRLKLTRDGEDGWKLEEANWWMPAKQHKLDRSINPIVRRGWVMNRIEAGDIVLIFSRRYDADTLKRLVEDLGMEFDSTESSAEQENLSREFA
jgi:hypothetical protein